MISSPSQGKMSVPPSLSLGPLASDQDQTTTTPRPSQRGQKGQAPRETEKEAGRKLDNLYGLSDKKRRRSLKNSTPPSRTVSQARISSSTSMTLEPGAPSAGWRTPATLTLFSHLPLKNHQQRRSTCRRSQDVCRAKGNEGTPFYLPAPCLDASPTNHKRP